MSDTAKTEQQATSAGRAVRIQTATHAAAPTDGAGGTSPDIVTSPVTPGGLPMTGLMLLLKAPTFGAAATSVAAGFQVVIWIRNPITYQWGATAQFQTPVDTWFSTFDFDGGELYFQIVAASVTGAGGIDISVVEQ